MKIGWLDGLHDWGLVALGPLHGLPGGGVGGHGALKKKKQFDSNKSITPKDANNPKSVPFTRINNKFKALL